jgi:hypothetical protein
MNSKRASFVRLLVLKIVVLLLGATMAAAVYAQARIPDGTILPVQLNTTISSKNKAGDPISARITQDVPLPEGQKIPERSTVFGTISGIGPAATGRGITVHLRFNTLKVHGSTMPISTGLRAIANMMDVDQAQVPIFGADRGTPRSAWTTVQVGGDVVYRGGGPVKGESGVAGKPVYPDGVLDELTANPDRGCDAANNRPQALWVFSSNACGTYGFRHLKIGHNGTTAPKGEIVLTSTRDKLKLRSGCGLLLETVAAETP